MSGPQLMVLLAAALGSLSVHATQLDLGAHCADNQIYVCALSNISATLDDPLQLNGSQPLPQLAELVVRDSVLGRVPQSLLALVPNLRVLLLHNCAVHRLLANDFAATPQLRRLLLQRQRLFDIPDRAFAPAYALEELLLGHSTVRILHRAAFAGLTRLRLLDLQHNGLRTLPLGVFGELAALQHLDLSANQLERIDMDTFAANRQLRALLLADNKFAEFAPDALAHVPRLHLLDISQCSVTALHVQSVDTLLAQGAGLQRLAIDGAVIKLHAGNNQLRNFSIGDKLAVRELELRVNRLETLDDCAGMLNLQRLDVSVNRLRTLSTSAAPLYVALPSLTYLALSANRLQELSAEHLLLLSKLTHLDVAFNRLQQLDVRAFAPLANLERLYLEGNGLQRMDYAQLASSHEHLRILGLFENDWERRYMLKMVAHLRDRGIELPERFESASGAILETSTRLPLPPGYQHREAAGSAEPEALLSLGATGIHPYWTTHNVLTMLTLMFVLLILFLQLLRILQDEGCLRSCWPGGSNAANTANTQHRRMQNEDEDDSEV